MKKKAAKTVILIFMLTLLGKLMGFLKSVLIASYFGANNTTDAYYLSNGIISDVFYAITMSVSIAFLPLYIRIKEEFGHEGSKQFASRVLVNMSLLSGAITLLLMILAPVIIKVTAYSYNDAQFQLAVMFLRIMSIGIIASLVADIIQNLLNAEEIYGYASLASIINSLVLVFAVVLFHKRLGIIALVVATPLSYVIQYCFLKIRSRKFVSFTLRYGIKDTNFKLLCRQSMPIFFSNATIEMNQLIDRVLLVSIAEGAVTALSYAAILFQFAAHVLSMPVSTVTYTDISQACARKEFDSVKNSLQQALKLFILIGIPIAIVIFFMPKLIVQIVYGRGEYDLTAITQTAVGLKYYAFCLIPYCIKQVFTKAFYSMEDTKTPMKTGILEVCLNIVSSIILSYFLGIKGVVIGTALASTIFSIVLILLFHKKYVKLSFRQDRKEIIKIFIVTIITIAFSVFVCKIELPIGTFLMFIVYSLAIILLYLILLWVMRVSLIRSFVKKLRNKLRNE